MKPWHWHTLNSSLIAMHFSGQSARAWLSAIALFILVFVGLKTTVAVSLRLLRLKLGSNTSAGALAIGIGRRTSSALLAVFAILVASERLTLSDHTRLIIDTVVTTTVFIQFALWGSGIIKVGVERYRLRAGDNERITTVVALGFIGTLLLWILLTLVALNNMGIDVTALLAGLGVGGVALALAVQTTLADILASLSIMFDKPFVLGDHITIDTYAGTVEYIGLKTTHLRSVSGEQIILSNSDLIKSRIRNYKRMRKRRISFILYVTYENRYEDVARISKVLQTLVEAENRVQFEYAHFTEYQAQALVFEVAYTVHERYADQYRHIQEAINLTIFKTFIEQGIEFAHAVTAHTQPSGRRLKEAT